MAGYETALLQNNRFSPSHKELAPGLNWGSLRGIAQPNGLDSSFDISIYAFAKSTFGGCFSSSAVTWKNSLALKLNIPARMFEGNICVLLL